MRMNAISERDQDTRHERIKNIILHILNVYNNSMCKENRTPESDIGSEGLVGHSQ